MRNRIHSVDDTGGGIKISKANSSGQRRGGHAHKNHGSNRGLTQAGKEVQLMAKDGTNRGGRRVRAGDKPTPLADKITAGKTAKVLETPDLKPAAPLVGTVLPSAPVLTGADMPDAMSSAHDQIRNHPR